jgi:hypothetical protein
MVARTLELVIRVAAPEFCDSDRALGCALLEAYQ